MAKYPVVVYGASGYTGMLTTRLGYLCQQLYAEGWTQN